MQKNIKKGYFSNKSLKLIAKNDCNLEAIEVDNILNNAEITAIPYLISYMYALELYKLYKVDPEKSLYILRKIIELNRNSEEEYYNIIKSFGLHPNDCLNKYYKKVERDALTLTRKKSKPNT